MWCQFNISYSLNLNDLDLPVPAPVVWSPTGPVPKLPVLLECLSQSKSSVVSCVHPHVPVSKSQRAIGKWREVRVELYFAITANSYKKKGFIFSIKLPVCVIVTNLKLKALSVVKSWHMAVYQSLYHQWQYLLPNHCLQRPGSSTTERNVQQIKI